MLTGLKQKMTVPFASERGQELAREERLEKKGIGYFDKSRRILRELIEYHLLSMKFLVFPSYTEISCS